VVIAKDGYDPCKGKNVGDTCDGGVLYAGTGFAGLGSYKYMTTPGNCTDSAMPTCDGSADTLSKLWANGSGTTANVLDTGATSNTDGSANTTILATNYTDTDAAKYCENMTYPAGGYIDWYLPSKDELYLVLYGMSVAGKGNFAAAASYCSSTDSQNFGVFYTRFPTGEQSNFMKVKNYYVRCVRKY
jgi:hypothetical protein